jgi:hypothetical protein
MKAQHVEITALLTLELTGSIQIKYVISRLIFEYLEVYGLSPDET